MKVAYIIEVEKYDVEFGMPWYAISYADDCAAKVCRKFKASTLESAKQKAHELGFTHYDFKERCVKLRANRNSSSSKISTKGTGNDFRKTNVEKRIRSGIILPVG